ncbi:unnamed protein product, partial [Owenia fusiformis]
VVLCICHAGRVRASCDCKLSATITPIKPEIINSRLDAQDAIIDSVADKYQTLLQDNQLKLERLKNAKKDAELGTDIVYNLANDCAKNGKLRCIESGECIHLLQGCDGVVDCLDGSDEENTTCVNPLKPGGKYQAILPKTQTCFPDAASFVRIIVIINSIVTSEHLPQYIVGTISGDYSFTDKEGRQITGAVPATYTYHIASGEARVKYMNDRYKFTGHAFLPYFLGSTPISGAYYHGHDLKEVCSDAVWYRVA